MANFVELKSELIDNTPVMDIERGMVTFYVNFDEVVYYYELDGFLHVLLKGQECSQSFHNTVEYVNQQLKKNQVANYFKTS